MTQETATMEAPVVAAEMKPRTKRASKSAKTNNKSDKTLHYKLGSNQKKFLSGLKPGQLYTKTQLREHGDHKGFYWMYTDYYLEHMPKKRLLVKKDKKYMLGDGLRLVN